MSLLAGRVFFKSIRYHGQNETVLVHDGYITWRYWLRHVQELEWYRSPVSEQTAPEEDSLSDPDAIEATVPGVGAGREIKIRRRPCRVLLKARGVEWFIYNRSPAYDAIFRSMRDPELAEHTKQNRTASKDAKPDSLKSETVFGKEEGNFGSNLKKEGGKCDDIVDDEKSSSTSSDISGLDSGPASAPLPGFLNLLPIGVECSKGAIVMGNRNTRSVLTAKFESAVGKIDARDSRPIDQYKQMLNFDFVHPVVEFKHNRDYTEPQLIEGAKSQIPAEHSLDARSKSKVFEELGYRTRIRNALTSIRNFVPYGAGSVESFSHPHSKSTKANNLAEDSAGAYGQSRWLGLTRYLDDEDDLIEQERWKAVEYAQFPTIVDSPIISMSFYWDVPGLTTSSTNSNLKASPGFEMDVNGDAPPDWGIDLKIGGGTIHYGPWADRQRSELQAVFFPTLYKDAFPAARLAPGQRRVSTVLKIVLEIEEQTTLRIPTREESKDWRWRGHKLSTPATGANNKRTKHHAKIGKNKKPTQPAEVRPPGWLDVKVLSDTTFNFSMDLVARDNGYRNRIELDLKGLEISSSVNHGLLLRSKSQSISCDLSNPLAWNHLRQWHVDIHDNAMELFILRDHMFLLTDLVSDWTSGPPGSFHTFVPFEYLIGLHLGDFRLYLNANDSNIVNNPSDLEDNTFIIVWGKSLKADLVIPAKSFRPARNKVTFDVEAYDGGFHLHTPPRNTQHTFLKSPNVASLKDLRINGSYSYCTTTSPTLTDILLLDVHGLSPKIYLYGFLIRYFMKIKDNYFGDDIHFRTLEEYQDQINKDKGQKTDDSVPAQHNRISNDLDVILGVHAENLCVLLPARLYSSDENIRLEILSLTSDLRITNYYMDLAVSSSPIAISHTSPGVRYQDEFENFAPTQMFIDGLQVFGHRLFGLPPTEPTYVCNWDFDVGFVTGECTIDFVRSLTTSLRCFGLTFDDAENALPPLNSLTIHDVTFLRARLKSISIGLRVEQAGFLFSTEMVEFDFNDWAGALFSDRLHLLVPDLTLAVVDALGMSTDRHTSQRMANTHAFLQTTLEINGVSRKQNFRANRHLQQNHIALHDKRTHRVQWLVHDNDQHDASEPALRVNKAKPPAMPFPSMPEPLLATKPSAIDDSSVTSKSVKPEFSTSASSRKSSFIVGTALKQDDVKTQYTSARTQPHQRQKGIIRDPSNGDDKVSTYKVLASQLTNDLLANEDVVEGATSPIDLPHSNLSFSSPYKRPHFPLLALKADTSDLPNLPEHLASDNLVKDSDALGGLQTQDNDQDTEQSSLMVNLRQGMQFLCTPEALFLVTELLAILRATDGVTLLDNLQIDAMTDLLSAGSTREKGNKVTDVRIFAPWVAVRFVNTSGTSSVGTTRQDRYDLTLDHLTATISLSSGWLKTSAPIGQSQFLVHLAVNQVNCSARECVKDKADDQAIIGLCINDYVFWMLYGNTAAAEMQFEKLEIVSASRNVDYISSLIRQTLVLGEDLGARFSKLDREGKSRIRLLVLLLATQGDDIPDPAFLTRVSYVIRSAAHHIRTSDSWKMMSRLRYVYQCLPERSRDKIYSQCTHKLASCPQDASQRVVSSFDHWQTWDLTQVKSSLLMQKVYGEHSKPPVPATDASVPFRATVRAGTIRVLVEPGPQQNEVSFTGLIVGLAINQPLPSSSRISHTTSDRTGSTIQVHFVEIAVRLNWSLLGLLENIVETIRTSTTLRPRDRGAAPGSQMSLGRGCLHIIVSSEMSILNCYTPNVKLVSLCQGLKTSIVTSEGSSSIRGPSVSIAVNVDAATSETKAHSTMLTLYKLRQAMIFGSKQDSIEKNIERPWKFVATGQDILFQIFANPLQLIEAADCFLEHEVAHILRWTKSLQPAQMSARSMVNTPKQTGLLKVEVALFLESYLLSLGILPSLTYQISGTRAGSSIKSGHSGNYDLAIDFGFNEHSHTFKAKRHDNDVSSLLSTLQMPPINGRLLLDLGPTQKSVEFNGLVESIIFDASAVHAIFTAINRPEIISLGSSIRKEVSVLRGHYEAIFGIMETGRNSQSFGPILYGGSVNLASLAIRARTSDSLSVAQGAELQFKMSRMQMKATNKESSSGTGMTFPELEVRLKSIDLNLLRYEKLDCLPCGNITIKAMIQSSSKVNDAGRRIRSLQIRSSSLQVNVFGETAPVMVAILVHLQNTLKTIDLSQEVQNLKKLRHTRLKSEVPSANGVESQVQGDNGATALFSAMYSLEMTNVCIVWRVENLKPISPGREPEHLILSLTKIDLATKKDNAARLLMENLQLQMLPAANVSMERSMNSALLPEVLFNVAYVSTAQDRRLAFQVVGKSLDLQLTSQFILPANDVRRSIALSIQQVRTATADWNASASVTDGQTKRLMGNKRLASLLVDADFAGAVVYIQGRNVADPQSLAINVLRGGRLPQHGRYNQFTPENASNSSTTLRAPGIAFKVEYKNAGAERQSLNAEMKVDASSNVLYPTVVPLVMEVSSAIKDIVREQEKSAKSSLPQPKFLEDERLRGADPAAIFGNCRLNLGLRICRQEFSMSCQPIARVAATAQFDDIYITISTVQSQEHGKFFIVSGAFTRLQASVQHVYSRESTGSFEVESIVVSLMNSKHVSSANGISAILNISPMKARINGKQSQDFLLFREIWVPPEIRRSTPAAAAVPASESQAFIMQRYQQIAATGAFPWNATVSIAELDIQVDLGQSLGKSAFVISGLWMSSKKTSDWEQNLCLGFRRMAVDSTGRMSCFVELQELKVRTSIRWPITEQMHNQTPLVQASLAFDVLRVKAAFDYQAFAIADITTFEFLMYNVRDLQNIGRDRLVGVLDGDNVQVFCTTTSASQIIALYQAFQKLHQEKLAAYQASLRDIEKFLRRKSSINPSVMRAAVKRQEDPIVNDVKSSLKLQTDVVVALKAVNIGAFPSTFFDNQIFKLEALDTSARFAVVLENERIHSTLGMTLGQLRIALAGIARASVPKTLGEVSVEDVVASATGSRGGTILKVPKLVATMETWQSPEGADIDYIFKSSFQGRVDVGWNYSRISYIRGMWTSHARALAQRLGKPLPQSAVQITGGPRPEGDEGSQTYIEGEEGKITAVVNVPQSKYQYTALQPPIIETPQLRDMGEATPPLEWIGLHREKLPNLTHQIIIVALLEVAKEVDDAYSKILGSS